MIKRKLMQELWEDFVWHGQLHRAVKKEVREAWLRSKAYGVDPYIHRGTNVMSPSELKSLQLKKKEFISTSLPLMEHLFSIVKGSGFLVILCDEHGRLIKMLGDKEPLRLAEKVQFLEGALWSEEAKGANGIGTCIARGKPTQIWEFEHYIQASHPWTCSAAPIRNSAGNMVGVLNMSGLGGKAHPHTLGLVVPSAEAIEKQLQMLEKSRGNEVKNRLLEVTTDTFAEGMIIIDTYGKIIKTNRVLQRIIQKKEHELLGKHVTDIFINRIFYDLPAIPNDLHQEIKLKLLNNLKQTHVLLTSKTIFQHSQKIGKLLTIKEIQRARPFIDPLSGSQEKVTFRDIVGKSKIIRKSKLEGKKAARSDSNVLLIGESGTGKDIFAQSIHNESKRKHKPFIVINCGGVPRDLLGSELFGYEDGAFTGTRRVGSSGKFELADGGTAFLNEIGEMSLEMQVVLLRILQEKEVVRIGGHKMIPIDVRIIAATNKNLHEEVEKGNFREDLFFHLNVIPIHLPPLREIREDIPLLAAHFIEKWAERWGKPFIKVSPSFYDTLQLYEWPGNIRELQHILEMALVRMSGCELGMEVLPVDLSRI
ncbi:sigma-54-dependent Fis family transcriptional regulator [Siminovitchia sp. FSL H7-0308]|uniref:sigma-54-dependent Fis family transcriptional regulator n=1 Tax=Siminovitchia sp. FSL H7-0308 TaxID=2921432 RepID=UPI0030EBF384